MLRRYLANTTWGFINLALNGAIMAPTDGDCSQEGQNANSETDTPRASDDESVPPSAREEEVLMFLADKGFPMPPAVIYRGMKATRSITFSYSTVKNILSRLEENGEAVRVDKDALDDGDITAAEDPSKHRKSYYFITETGRQRIGYA